MVLKTAYHNFKTGEFAKKSRRCPKLCHTKMKHYDWLLHVVWLVLTNQRALFQGNVAMLLLKLFMTSALENVDDARKELYCVWKTKINFKKS